MVEDDAADAGHGARGAGGRRALRRPRRAAAGSTAPATRRSRRPRASCCACSTTTWRRGRAGSTRCSRRAAAHPGHDAFGGPIRGRLEGARLHACGREPPPVTTLDLGPADARRRARSGARTSRCAARALDRAGWFDPARSGAGDEEEWERRLRAAGGRIRYVAARGRGPPPGGSRRAPAEPRPRRLPPRPRTRAATTRRRARQPRARAARSARSPAARGTPAGAAAATGLVLAAHSAGRLREALRAGGPRRPSRRRHASPTGPRASRGRSGRRALVDRARPDLAADLRTARRRLGLRRAARHAPPRRRVHVVGVARPERARDDRRGCAASSRARAHAVAVDLHAGRPRRRASGRTCARRWPRGRPTAPTGSSWSTTTSCFRAASWTRSCTCAERHGLAARPARPRLRLPRRLAGHAPAAAGASPGARASSRSGRVTARPPRRLRTSCSRFPTCAMGWGLDAHWSAAAAAARAAARRGGRDAGPPPAAGRRRLPARGGGRGGRGVPGRPAVRHARGGGSRARRVALMRVAVVAEYYPRAADPVLGVWAHRQALAARDAGADVRVLVLHRPVPSRAALAARDPRRARRAVPPAAPHGAGRARASTYVPFLAPPRPRTYGAWGAWAAPSLALALRALRRTFPFDLVHAHYAAPAGDAVRRARPGVPVVVSVHGGDLLAVAARSAAGARAVRAGLRARAARARQLGRDGRPRARARRGRRARRPSRHGPAAGPPAARARRPAGHRRPPRRAQAPRRRPAGAVAAARRASRSCAGRWSATAPSAARWSGWRRELGLAAGSGSTASCPPPRRSRVARRGALFVLPSVDEAFGVAYVEAMAGAVPAIGCRGEPGPEEIAAAGGGLLLVPPGRSRRRSPPRSARWPTSRERRRELGAAARATVAAAFTWERCGRETVRGLRGRAAGMTRSAAGPLRHQPRAGLPRRRLRRACTPARTWSSRSSAGGVRHGGGAGGGDALPFPVRPPAAARGPAARRLRALPRRRGRPVGPRRPARRLRRRPPGRRAVRPVGDDLARTRARPRTPSPTCRSATSTATPTRSPPTGRTCQRLRARQGRARPRRRGAAERRRRVLVRAGRAAPRHAPFQVLFAGRLERGEGRRRCCLRPGRASAAGTGCRAGPGRRTARCASRRPPPRRGRARRAARPARRCAPSTPGSDVVVVPSIPTRDFLEPWGLVVNEAFHRGVPVVATTAVGAVAGGLVRHERNGARRRRPAIRTRSPPPCAACTTTRRCARGSARRRARTSPRTPTRPGRRACSARWPPRAPHAHAPEAPGTAASLLRRGPRRPDHRARTAARARVHRDGRRADRDPPRLPGRLAERDLHAGGAARRAGQHPGRHRPVLRLPRRALPRAAERPAAAVAAAGTRPAAAARPAAATGGGGGTGGSVRQRHRRRRRARRLHRRRAAHPERPGGAGGARRGGPLGRRRDASGHLGADRPGRERPRSRRGPAHACRAACSSPSSCSPSRPWPRPPRWCAGVSSIAGPLRAPRPAPAARPAAVVVPRAGSGVALALGVALLLVLAAFVADGGLRLEPTTTVEIGLHARRRRPAAPRRCCTRARGRCPWPAPRRCSASRCSPATRRCPSPGRSRRPTPGSRRAGRCPTSACSPAAMALVAPRAAALAGAAARHRARLRRRLRLGAAHEGVPRRAGRDGALRAAAGAVRLLERRRPDGRARRPAAAVAGRAPLRPRGGQRARLAGHRAAARLPDALLLARRAARARRRACCSGSRSCRCGCAAPWCSWARWPAPCP